MDKSPVEHSEVVWIGNQAQARVGCHSAKPSCSISASRARLLKARRLALLQGTSGD
jgi:hypothetical protein